MVDYIKAAKNIISGKGPFDETVPAPDKRLDRIDQCKVVWYQWENELGTKPGGLFGEAAKQLLSSNEKDLAKARSYDISNHIESFSYTKGMGEAAGAFQLVLQNSFDWSRFMRPGQWLCVYLAGDGSLPLPKEVSSTKASGFSFRTATPKALAASVTGMHPTPELPLPAGPKGKDAAGFLPKLRCMGIIQRVGIQSTTSPDGGVSLSYVVTGKDFGAVYEETEVWFNANNGEAIAFENAINAISEQFVRNLTELLKQYHDIFLDPASKLSTSFNLSTFFPKQWLLPDQLVKDLSLGTKNGSGYFGDIKDLMEFNATVFENPMSNPLAGLEGRCWDRLKALSQPEFHELFTELSDSGHPRIIFRPIPWASDKSGYPTLGKLIFKYEDLAKPDPLAPPLPVGSIASKFANLGAFNSALEGAKQLAKTVDTDFRTRHSVPLTAAEVEHFNVGPDYHSRANFFLVDAKTGPFTQVSAWGLLTHSPMVTFPLRDEDDIKRHGFRPIFADITSFLISNAQLFGKESVKTFMLEANALLQDYHFNAEDLYTGTIVLAAGKNSVKLGKVLVTDGSFQGIPNMAFYVESYTDSFVVSPDGTCSWTQTVEVTRGTELASFKGSSTKDKAATKTGTFHARDNSNDQSSSPLDKIKKTVKNPASLLKG